MMNGLMPAVFVGHGSPMNAIEDNEFSRGWRKAAQACPRPHAVLCVSAHWETRGVHVTAARQHETIHDFYGFPKALYDMRYPAPGDAVLAKRIVGLLKKHGAKLDAKRGLDHGCWSVLRAMYPEADIPVIQLSIDTGEPASVHYALAKNLHKLREEGILILGSGNIVHNLGIMEFDNPNGFEWATRIAETMKQRIAAGDHTSLAEYSSLDQEIRLAIPTPEHYLPLLYVLSLQQKGEAVSFFNERCVMGSISMTCVRVN